MTQVCGLSNQADCREKPPDVEKEMIRTEEKDKEPERADLGFLKHTILEALTEVGHHGWPVAHSRIKEQASRQSRRWGSECQAFSEGGVAGSV